MKVIYANSNNMDMINALLNNSNVVVFFTAPWCGHCQRLKPVMNNVFGRFKSYKSPGSIISVSENEMPRLTVDNNIRGFPTIRHYNNGTKVNDYNGMRDEKSISDYLAKIFNENLRLRTLNKFKSILEQKKRKRIKKTNKKTKSKSNKKTKSKSNKKTKSKSNKKTKSKSNKKTNKKTKSKSKKQKKRKGK